jgi:hypothetical protein
MRFTSRASAPGTDEERKLITLVPPGRVLENYGARARAGLV